MVLRNLSTSVPEIFHSTHFIRTILTFPVQPVLRALRASPISPRSWNISIKILISIRISSGSLFRRGASLDFRTLSISGSRLCLSFQLWSTVTISRQILYTRACPPPPVSFHPPTYPSFFAHTPQENGHRPCFFLHPALDFLFLSILFLFFILFLLPPAIHPRRHPSSKHAATDRHAVRESFLHTPRLVQTPPSPFPSPPLPHPLLWSGPITPFILVPACAAASSLGEYQRSSCLGGIQRGATRQAASVARSGGIQFRFFQHRPYAIVVCPRTPYRDDVLAPL